MNAGDLSGRYILIDSNLCVLLCVGLLNITYVRRHKRLASYDETDFRILKDIVDRALGLMVSPNVASETSNLARQIGSPAREQIAEVLKGVVERAKETYVASREAVRDPAYMRLGITDAALLRLLDARSDLVLLTADHDLHVAAIHRRLPAMNFNYLRDQRSDFK